MSICECNDVRLGMETLTGSRFLGKQVYVKLIEFGSLPLSGEKNVAHGITDADQIGVDYARSWVDSGTGTRYGVDFPNTGANAFWRVKVDAANVGIQVGKDRSTFTAMICIWFTKADEQPGEGECIKEAIQALNNRLDAMNADAPSLSQVQQMIQNAIESGGGSSAYNLQIGVETRMNWYYMGKPVYAQLVDYGPMPNKGFKYVDHGIEDIDWASIHYGLSSIIWPGGACSGPCNTNPTSLASGWNTSISKTQIVVNTGSDRRSLSAIICALYTKTTDPAIS